jgi:hypothetical protein
MCSYKYNRHNTSITYIYLYIYITSLGIYVIKIIDLDVSLTENISFARHITVQKNKDAVVPSGGLHMYTSTSR